MTSDLNIFLPNSDRNWVIKNNIIYYHKYVDVAVLNIIDDIIWISLDRKIKKPIIKLIKHLTNLNVDFYFTTSFNIPNKQIYKEDLQDIIENYLLSLTDELFFDDIFDTGFDYVQNLTNFMTDYDCHGLFKEPFENIKKYYLSEKYDWYTNKKYYIVKKEYIRDFISTLEREIKLNMFL